MKQKPINGLMFFTLILMDLLSGMEFDLFVPSFPEIQNHFHLNTVWLEALLSVNFIGFGFSMLYVGALSDRYGRKPIILAGLFMFILGSSFCLWPLSYSWLLLGRFLQGLGIAAPHILSFLIIADSYSIKKQQFYLGILNGVINTAVAGAPVLGSYITLYFHWQGNFTALLILACISFLTTLAFLPKEQKAKVHEPISLKSYLPLLRSKPQMLLILHLVFLFIPYWIFVGMSPVLFMKDLSVSLTHFGYYQGSLALIFAFGSISFSFSLEYFQEKTLQILTKYLYYFGFLCIGAATVFNTDNPLWITLALMSFVVSQIIPSALLYPVCINVFPKAKGRASGLLQVIKLILCSISLQLAGYFYDNSFRNIGIILLGFLLLVIVTYSSALNYKPKTAEVNKA
jgi:DHA1 family bicyclomycin/chloramphenicol resistance-like MFS transporter